MTTTPEVSESSPVSPAYTSPIMLGNGQFEIDTTPDGDGDLEVCNVDGDHIAYLGPADQIVLRDLLNKIRPAAAGRVITTVEELDALPVGSVVLRNGRAFQRFAPRPAAFDEYKMWQCTDGGFVRSTKDGSTILPATLVHEAAK